MVSDDDDKIDRDNVKMYDKEIKNVRRKTFLNLSRVYGHSNAQGRPRFFDVITDNCVFECFLISCSCVN